MIGNCVMFFVIVFILAGFSLSVLAGQDAAQPAQTETVEEWKDKVAKAGDTAEKKVNEYSSKLEAFLDVVVEKYKRIKPKIQEMIKTIQEKKEELSAVDQQ